MLLNIVMVCYVALRSILTLGLLRRQSRSEARPSVSVVVAARDEATSLSTLLDNLLQQNYGDYEVVIVNDRSTDETATILDAWQKRSGRLRVVNVSEVPEGRTPKMHALGLGIAASKGDIITLTDADCRVPPTWIEGLTASFTADVGAVIGYVGLRAAHNTWLEHVQALDYFAMMATMAGATKLGQPIGAAGANIAYRRAAYDAVGGFEAMPLGAVADDMVMLQQVLDHTDWRVVFCDDERAFITTDAEPTLELLFNQRVRWMAGGQEVLRHNPALLTTGMLIGTLNGILMSFPLLLGRRDLRRALLYAVVGRTLADALHLGVAAVHFRRVELLWYLPLWILLQIPYTTLLPLYSASRKWSWK